MKTGSAQQRKAQRIASEWHGGQWSVLYQFCSSGIFHYPNVLRYFQELETCLHPEYNLHPGELNKKELTELTWLKNYFLTCCKEIGIEITFVTHSVYGYLMPFICKWNDENDLTKVHALRYAV